MWMANFVPNRAVSLKSSLKADQLSSNLLRLEWTWVWKTGRSLICSNSSTRSTSQRVRYSHIWDWHIEMSWNVMLSVSTAMIKPFPWNVYSSQDSGGSIHEKKFVKTLYPDEYRMLHLCYKVYILVNTHLEHHLENAPTTFNLGRCSKCHT
jgi:hypothetical protein